MALLADLIHNAGDALTAIPVGAAFLLRSERAEKWAGYAVVLAIFVSACVALYETIQRLIHPEELSHLWALAGAGLIGFMGNELAARIRLHAGGRLSSPALVADGHHARVDGFVSLGVVASAALVGLGWEEGDPIVGLLITLVILKVTWDAWRTVREVRSRPFGRVPVTPTSCCRAGMRPGWHARPSQRRFGRVENSDCSLFRRITLAAVVDDHAGLAAVVERHTPV